MNATKRKVSHDEDGYWSFLCGGSHSEKDLRIVSLLEILEQDESVADLSCLDYGEYAEAENEQSNWVVMKE